jgi:hypothetical protein
MSKEERTAKAKRPMYRKAKATVLLEMILEERSSHEGNAMLTAGA